MGWALLQGGKGSWGYRAEGQPASAAYTDDDPRAWDALPMRGRGTLHFEAAKLLDKRKFRATWLIHLRANEAG